MNISDSYLAKLHEKKKKLEDQQKKEVVVRSKDGGIYLITCYQSNIINNANGLYKWDGWEIIEKKYSMNLYAADENHNRVGEMLWHCTDTNKEDANMHFKELYERTKSGNID